MSAFFGFNKTFLIKYARLKGIIKKAELIIFFLVNI